MFRCRFACWLKWRMILWSGVRAICAGQTGIVTWWWWLSYLLYVLCKGTAYTFPLLSVHSEIYFFSVQFLSDVALCFNLKKKLFSFLSSIL